MARGWPRIDFNYLIDLSGNGEEKLFMHQNITYRNLTNIKTRELYVLCRRCHYLCHELKDEIKRRIPHCKPKSLHRKVVRAAKRFLEIKKGKSRYLSDSFLNSLKYC